MAERMRKIRELMAPEGQLSGVVLTRNTEMKLFPSFSCETPRSWLYFAGSFHDGSINQIRLGLCRQNTENEMESYRRKWIIPNSNLIRLPGTIRKSPTKGFEWPEPKPVINKQNVPKEANVFVNEILLKLEHWIASTYHGAIYPKYMDGYLNEFCFHFNNSISRGEYGPLFYKMILRAMNEYPPKENLEGDANCQKGVNT